MQHIYTYIVHTQTKHLLLVVIHKFNLMRVFFSFISLDFVVVIFSHLSIYLDVFSTRFFLLFDTHFNFFFFLLWFAIEVFTVSMLSLVSKMRKIYNRQMLYNYVGSLRNSVEIENRLIIFETIFYTTEISSPWFWCSGFVSISHSLQPTFELIPLTCNWRTILCS